MAIPPSWIVLHTMVGTIDSSNSRFQDSEQQASAHYGVGYEGTRLVQWVDEGDAAWHAGTAAANLDSIGIEHEDDGYYDDPRPDGLYYLSAALVRDICDRYSIPCRRGDYAAGIPGIVDHRTIIQTGCPDALDTDRIVRMAAAGEGSWSGAPPPPPPPPPTPEEIEMLLFKGSADPIYLVSGPAVVHVDDLADLAAIQAAGVKMVTVTDTFVQSLQAASTGEISTELAAMTAQLQKLAVA
jgi:hypothetical protein